VLPWYGSDISGGAETDARHTAEHLRAAGVPVEVWTTCAHGPGSDWNLDHCQPGTRLIHDVAVTRFPVTPVRRDDYATIHRQLARGRRVTPRQEALFFAQSIRSRALEAHIRARPEYRCVFTPYLYGTTYWGAYVAPERSFLLPCLHDEGFARMAALGHLFRRVRGMLCNSSAEARLVQRLHGVPQERLSIVGDGITLGAPGNAQAFRARFGIFAPFLLYAGRKSRGKNVSLLLTYFRRYRQRRYTDLELVLIGGGQLAIPPDCRPFVHDLGFVSEQDKRNAYAAAAVFCQPSVQESFSIVLMEAWVQSTPALVNAHCDVTREHCEQGQGGLYFGNYQEFEATLDLLLNDAVLRQRLGQLGRRYVERNFTWEQVMRRVLEAVGG
jgi:glycosyltransferase involved in cell wall biosynthesis